MQQEKPATRGQPQHSTARAKSTQQQRGHTVKERKKTIEDKIKQEHIHCPFLGQEPKISHSGIPGDKTFPVQTLVNSIFTAVIYIKPTYMINSITQHYIFALNNHMHIKETDYKKLVIYFYNKHIYPDSTTFNTLNFLLKITSGIISL